MKIDQYANKLFIIKKTYSSKVVLKNIFCSNLSISSSKILQYNTKIRWVKVLLKDMMNVIRSQVKI